MNKISKVSYKFSLLFKGLIALYPLFVIGIWLGKMPVGFGFSITARLPLEEMGVKFESIRLALRMYACLVDMIPTVIIMFSFYYLVKLFQLYAQNIIFSDRNVIYIRKIGYTLLLQVLATFLILPILTLILTIDAPANGHIVSLAFGTDSLSTLIIGGIVVLISWIMEEGRKLEEETIYTV